MLGDKCSNDNIQSKVDALLGLMEGCGKESLGYQVMKDAAHLITALDHINQTFVYAAVQAGFVYDPELRPIHDPNGEPNRTHQAFEWLLAQDFGGKKSAALAKAEVAREIINFLNKEYPGEQSGQ